MTQDRRSAAVRAGEGFDEGIGQGLLDRGPKPLDTTVDEGSAEGDRLPHFLTFEFREFLGVFGDRRGPPGQVFHAFGDRKLRPPRLRLHCRIDGAVDVVGRSSGVVCDDVFGGGVHQIMQRRTLGVLPFSTDQVL